MSETSSLRLRQRGVRAVTLVLAIAAVIVVAAGGLTWAELDELSTTTVPVLAFVLAMTIVAELASVAGVFTVLAGHLALWGRGRVTVLWALVLVMIVLITAFMSLDTTAVLVTPIIVVLARRIGLSPLPFALATVWLANTGSLFLPVSNLTNLIAGDTFGAAPADFIGFLWAPALASVLITIGMLTIVYRRSLTGRYRLDTPAEAPDRLLLIIAMVVVGLLVPLLVSGIDVAVVAGGAAAVLFIAFAIRNRGALSFGLVPWRTLGFAASLFVLVQAAHSHGLAAVATAAAGTGDDVVGLLQVAAVGALGANAVNNLPAFMALAPVAESPLRMGALLIGVNLAPLVSPWASLATLLWHQRLKSLGVEISWRRYALLGAVLAVVLVPITVVALWAAGTGG
ncbi:SLC13 family permease [Brevibacterium sp. CFH 10365]|uniref:SLC13 family permease n=1 Tax=Brevibacterium sp. CFH 10365 TaxID=2585207 RepID=UPI001D0D60BD|nr:SLC13 family permease [Brevibacterium sp. CFH 10365]